MDDARKSSKSKTEDRHIISEQEKSEGHKENVRLIQANHMRTIQSVRSRQDTVLYKDSGC